MSNNLPRVVFAGTPDFAVPSLRALACADELIDLVAVYTQPDRRAGRGRKLRESDVKQQASKLDIEVRQPHSLRDKQAKQALADLRPDLMIVAAYGLILPQSVLDIPRLGCVNVHASLLPRWRGAAPVQRAMIAGDEQTGVTLMQMNAGLDTGDMLAKIQTPIKKDDTGETLTARLANLGAELLADSLQRILTGDLTAIAQDDSLACYAPKLKKSEAKIDWQQSAADIERMVRAFNSWPVAETSFGGRQLRIWSADCHGDSSAPPGTVLPADGDSLAVATGDGVLQINRLQPSGKRVMTARDFLAAHDISGVVLGAADEQS